MNWNQLQYVITIAEEKSITKAAQKLYISQPSLSLSIQALEKETGIPLFERNRGEMKLTYAGSLFYEWAISTLHSHTQLEWKLGDIVSGSRTLIRLGLSPHRSERLLAPVLERFYSMYENCDIQIIEQPTYILRQMLEEDKLDLIQFMDDKGVFLIKGAIDKVAERLNISKVTVYSYLDKIKKTADN